MFKRIIYVFVLVIAILFTAFILPSENAFADETLLHDELIEETNCIETSEEVGNDETVETSEIPTDSLLETEDVPETENISESEAEAEVPEFSSDNIDIEQNEVESILEDSINSEDLSIDQPTPMIGYTKSSVNVRSMPNGDPIGTISLGQQVSGNLENDWLKISFNNSVGYIHSSLIQENPVQVNRYIMGGTNIRNRPNGSVIEYLDLPIHVNATIEGSWLKFMRNGQMCYVHQVRTQTDAPTITGYASTQINLRTSPNGTLVGRTLRGERVEGTLEGDWVRYNRNGLICYLYAPLLQQNPIRESVYIKAFSNIRNSPNGSVTEYLELPLYVNAIVEGSWLKFMRNGQMCYVHQVRTQTDAPTITGYASTQINLRTSPNGTLVGRTIRGEKIAGTLEGNWVRHNRNGLICYLYAPLLQKEPIYISRYIKAGSNLRQSPNGTIITNIDHPRYVTGIFEKNWLKINYSGQTAYVHESCTQDNAPYFSGYASDSIYVRKTPGGEILGIIHKGVPVEGTMNANSLRISFNGATGYVYITQTQKDKVWGTWNFDRFSYHDGKLYVNDWKGYNISSRYVGGNHILVSLTHQYMWVFNNYSLVMGTPIVSGKTITPTVVGKFSIVYKQRSVYLRGTHYVDYWMPFYGDYGIHDAHWQDPSNFFMYSTANVYQGSAGCVNVPPANMATVFYNVSPGTPVTVVK